jgi:flagellar basal body-associated protein FliL
VDMLGKLLDRFRQSGPSRPRSKAETEKRRRLVIVLLIVLAVVSSVSVVGYGYYDTSIRPWHGRIVKVNGTVIEMRSFLKMFRLYGGASNPSTSLAQQVVTSMEDNELMRQGLEDQFGVDIGSVTSDEAVDAKLRAMLVSDNATDEEFNQQYDSLVANLKTYGLSAKDFRELYIEPSLVQEEFQKQIGDRDYPVTDNFDHAQVQALLITGSDNATAVRDQWMGAADQDAEFQLLAADNATYKPVKKYLKTNEDNTTIVWVAKGIESTAFDNYTFSVELDGEIGQPFPDSEGSENYWVIKVLARESRPLSESDRTTLISKASTKWLEDAKNSEDNVIVNYLDKKGGQAKLAWALAHVAVSTS